MHHIAHHIHVARNYQKVQSLLEMFSDVFRANRAIADRIDLPYCYERAAEFCHRDFASSRVLKRLNVCLLYTSDAADE